MWTDNETELDFLNFTGVADTVAEIIVQAQGSPISIGVSGAWGVGKSSMIRLIRRSLERRQSTDFIFVEFNAWLYQGYDDARAALLEVIGSKLTKEAESRKKGVEKAKEFLQRINWFRAAKLVAGSAISMSMGMPPIGLVGEIYGIGEKLIAGDVDEKTAGDIEHAASGVAGAASGLLKPKKKTSPPKEIQALRDSFEETYHENYFCLSRFLLGCQCDGVAQTFQAMHQVSSKVVLVELVQVKISQVVVGDLLGKHVIDRDQDFVGHRHHCAFVPASCLETEKFVSQISAFGSGRRAGGLH